MATTEVAIAPMKAAVISKPGAEFKIVERETPNPELMGVRPMIETYPLDKAAEAYARMIRGKAQFRVVLTM